MKSVVKRRIPVCIPQTRSVTGHCSDPGNAQFCLQTTVKNWSDGKGRFVKAIDWQPRVGLGNKIAAGMIMVIEAATLGNMGNKTATRALAVAAAVRASSGGNAVRARIQLWCDHCAVCSVSHPCLVDKDTRLEWEEGWFTGAYHDLKK